MTEIDQNLQLQNQNQNHLNYLAVAHYVIGSLFVLFACIPLIHFTIGLFFLIGGDSLAQSNPDNPPPEFVGWLFLILGGLFFLIGQIIAFSVIFSGWFLQKRTRYTFSFIVACIACTIMPFGTILGILTIIVLMKPEVKALYE